MKQEQSFDINSDCRAAAESAPYNGRPVKYTTNTAVCVLSLSAYIGGGMAYCRFIPIYWLWIILAAYIAILYSLLSAVCSPVESLSSRWEAGKSVFTKISAEQFPVVNTQPQVDLEKNIQEVLRPS